MWAVSAYSKWAQLFQ